MISRRRRGARSALALALVGIAGGPLRPRAQAPAPAEHTPSGPPLGSSVFPADTGRVRQAAFGSSRALVDTVTANLSRLEIHVTTLAPGRMVHPPHRHPHEELMIVRTGTLEVCQNGATRRAGPGSVIFEAANELHGLRNAGPDSATYVVIRLDPHDLRPAPPPPDHATCPSDN
ncbi:MAG TPA: cupin domain-containing protein [Gemmatimonadales bacterium]|nr:cupin domain-containing protein [Gemmatimonadales bacterium]